MATIETQGDESIAVGEHGDGVVRLTVSDPCFGRIAAVRLDHAQAARLASALDERLVAAAGGTPLAPE
jgi:hypothetical protein